VDAINVICQAEAIHPFLTTISNGGRSLFFIAANVQIFMVRAAVGEAVNQPGIAVKGKDDRLIRSEDALVIFIADAVRMFAWRLEHHQIHNVYHPNFNRADADAGSQRQPGSIVGISPTTGHNNIWFRALVIASPSPRCDALGAVLDSSIHIQILQRRLLTGNNDVDIVARTQTVVGHG